MVKQQANKYKQCIPVEASGCVETTLFATKKGTISAIGDIYDTMEKQQQQHVDVDDDDDESVDTDTFYKSDTGETETEDEEVKRNCIMGESGMRDSDFSDSDFEDDDDEKGLEADTENFEHDENWMTNKVESHRRNLSEEDDDEEEEEPEAALVKFVSISGQIPESRKGTIHRPTPIRNVSVMMPVCIIKDGEGAVDEEEKFQRLRDLEDNNADIKNKMLKTEGKALTSDTETIGTADTDIMMEFPSPEFAFDDEKDITIEVRVQGSSSAVALEFDDGYDPHDQQTYESVNRNVALVGASGASVDDIKWEIDKQKRVLSSNTLNALNQEANHHTDSLKRSRYSRMYHNNNENNGYTFPNSIPSNTRDIEALYQIVQPLSRSPQIRDNPYPLILSPSPKEGDRILRAELEQKLYGRLLNEESSPVPLLTPPQSPIMTDDTTTATMMTVLEWPSNLVMDNAQIKATSHRSSIALEELSFIKDRINSDLKGLFIV